MHDVLAMVLAAGRVDELSVLTMHRPKSALPFGGLYRVIDFPLSNLMHSSVHRIGILSQYRPFSLMNHIGNGSSWDMHGRHSSLHVLPPFKGHKPQDWYRGTADAIYQNLDYIRKAKPAYVLILSGDHVYRMNYRKMLDYHLDKNADLTVAFKQMPLNQCTRFGLGHFDDSQSGYQGGRLGNYTEKPLNPKSTWASMTVYLFNTDVLIDVIQQYVGIQGKTDFGKHILPEIVHTHNVHGYKFYDFWGYTRTISEYYQSNMNLLGDHPEIDPEQWRIRTNLTHRNVHDHMAALVVNTGTIKNSLFYNGCQIQGSVENSILFPGVTIGPGATIRDSIIFHDTQISAGATINSAIIDADARIGRHAVIGESMLKKVNSNLENIITLVGQDAVIEDGQVVLPGTHISSESGPEQHYYLQAKEAI